MATFIANLVETATGTTLDSSGDTYTDDDGNVHEGDIQKMSNAGIAQGVGGGLYAPGAPVTRAQMATFIANATRLPRRRPGQRLDAAGVVDRLLH